MSNADIYAAFRTLTPAQQQSVLDWLDAVLESDTVCFDPIHTLTQQIYAVK